MRPSERLPLTLGEFIAFFAAREQHVVPHGITHYGSCAHYGDSFALALRLPACFIEIGHWADSDYRRVWVNADDNAVITYCEHDVSVDVASDASNFITWIDEIERYYSRG